jgi:hypothetical protein
MHMLGTQEWADMLLDEKAVDGGNGRSQAMGYLPLPHVFPCSAQKCALKELGQQGLNAWFGPGPVLAWRALRSLHRGEKEEYALGDVGVDEEELRGGWGIDDWEKMEERLFQARGGMQEVLGEPCVIPLKGCSEFVRVQSQDVPVSSQPWHGH